MWNMDGKVCTIENISASGNCLNVAKYSVKNGDQAQLWDNPECPSTPWLIHAAGEPGIYIVARWNVLNSASFVVATEEMASTSSAITTSSFTKAQVVLQDSLQ